MDFGSDADIYMYYVYCILILALHILLFSACTSGTVQEAPHYQYSVMSVLQYNARIIMACTMENFKGVAG